MLTPMQVQYLVGLCCLKQNPNSINVTIGDMVMDEAAEKERDVDITVTFTENNGESYAFKAFEVKKESKPLDVVSVEQLCIKLNDMSDITHRAIVSASGYTKSSLAKATKHNVDLYELKPWTTTLSEHFKSFNDIGHIEDFMKIESSLLCWENYEIYFTVFNDVNRFLWKGTDNIYTKNGKLHKKFVNLDDFCNQMLLRSTNALLNIEQISKVNFGQPLQSLGLLTPFSHSHTLDVYDTTAYIKINESYCQVKNITISGQLYWDTKQTNPEYIIIQNILTKEIYAGATIAKLYSPDDKMIAFILTPNSDSINFHHINLSEKQKNIIKKLKIHHP